MTVSGAEPGIEMGSPLPVVCSFWREFDLEGMRPKLDEIGLKVAEHQEESVQHRRKLAEATREFKKNNEAVSKTVGPLLKQYQEEIDRLTKRAKHGETAFLDLYQKLYEAPDPAPALATAFEHASRATDLEAQFKKLSQELAEYKAESAQIKNQDLTVRKLEEKVRALEAHLEEKEKELDEVGSPVEACGVAQPRSVAQLGPPKQNRQPHCNVAPRPLHSTNLCTWPCHPTYHPTQPQCRRMAVLRAQPPRPSPAPPTPRIFPPGSAMPDRSSPPPINPHLPPRSRTFLQVRERAVAEADAQRVAAMQSREEELEAMLQQAQASLAAMQKLYTGAENQLFAIQSQSEEERMGRQAELELASAELERATERLAALEREKQGLVEQLQSGQGAGGAGRGHGVGAGREGAAAVAHSIEETLRSELGVQRELASRLRSELVGVGYGGVTYWERVQRWGRDGGSGSGEALAGGDVGASLVDGAGGGSGHTMARRTGCSAALWDRSAAVARRGPGSLAQGH